MSDHNKKIFPKMKKQLKGFLTDESGKVTKQDVLKLALGAMMIGTMLDQAEAACSPSSSTTFANFGSNIGVAWPVSNNTLPPNITNPGECFAGINTPYSTLNGTVYTDPTVAPYTYSATVNGHANGSGSASIQGGDFNGGSLTTVAWHGSHGSHGSHAQW